MTIGLVAFSVALVLCAIVAHRSKKSISFNLALMELSLIPPLLGNLLIIVSGNPTVSYIGGYLYFIGMDLAVAALLRFTADFCNIPYRGTLAHKLTLAVLIADIVQLLLNPLFGHAFAMHEIVVEGAPYYALVPLAGQVYHRVVAYAIFFVSIGIFAYRTFTSPTVYLERYAVILSALLLTGACESYYIFLEIPIDLSMLAFGLFGLLIMLLTIYYKPVLLLNGILARVVGDMSDAVFFFDRDRMCIYSNAVGEKLFQIKDESGLERIRETLAGIVGHDQFTVDTDWSCRCRVLVDENGHITRANLNEGMPEPSLGASQRYWQLTLQTLRDDRERQVGTFLTLHDRTSEELQLQRERHAAEHDELTDLYNSSHLYAVARILIQENPRVRFYAVGIDVREFKLINDIFSKDFGDKVLCDIADAIRETATPNEVFGRISGDRFGFLLPANEFDPNLIEQRLSQDNFITGSDFNYPIIIHAGIYEVTERSLPVSVMFDRAFMALAPIKQDYNKRIAYYDDTMREDAIWVQKISAELDNAIATGQIRPYLQPMVDNRGVVEGAEVLVRWIHPEEGFLSPARFTPYFEDNGRIAQVDMYMWECACKTLAKWGDQGIDMFLSVNISPKDFYFMDVPEVICGLVDKYHVNPKRLRLEITETVMMSDLDNRLRIVNNLRSAGFLVEMDDFGSGYSSLNMLKDIPVDILKIDMVFLYDTKDKRRAETILQTIVNLSNELNIPSVTEGVETAEQLKMLKSMGCHLYQGYYFAKPMPLEEFEEKYCRNREHSRQKLLFSAQAQRRTSRPAR